MRLLLVSTCLLACLVPYVATADEAKPTPPAPPPYSLPWQLRPAVVVNVFRSDTTIAFLHDAAGRGGTTFATTLLAGWKVNPSVGLIARGALVHSGPPTGDSATVLSNPVLGATWLLVPADGVKVALFLGLAFPFGAGGGNDGAAASLAAQRAGAAARSAMDNALFAVNDLTVFPGVDVAYVKGGLTVQAEATVLQLTRVKGEAKQADASKTNLTAGLHVGWFADPALSVGGELRMQRWLSTPAAVTANADARETVTAALGVRWHHRFSNGQFVRPGLSYVFALDAPLSTQGYRILQLDVPFIF